MKKSCLFLLWLSPAFAQFYNITTVAGIGRMQFPSNGGVAINARLIEPKGVQPDPRLIPEPENTVELPVVASSPGVFAITNTDGSVNSSGNPSDAEGTLVIYATGEGKTDPPVADGTVNSSVFPKPLLAVSVLIDGQDAIVPYAGAAPGFVAGVLQVNVQIPAGVHGTVSLQIKIGDAMTPAGLKISVR